jgi:uncharacterized membrane protein
MRAALVASVLVAALGLLQSAPASAGPLQQRELVLTVAVKGNGHVTSNDGQIDCPSDCQGSYFFDGEGDPPTVTLTADPDTDWKFVEWSGDCSGHDEQCTVVMDVDLRRHRRLRPGRVGPDRECQGRGNRHQRRRADQLPE